ncbi:MAG: DUF6273 domain-containing protein [Clostridiales bacterium]|jgi:hypothetical protein|nr:DUF6273 domain-containing protein [Clostridiales bacterium]
MFGRDKKKEKVTEVVHGDKSVSTTRNIALVNYITTTNYTLAFEELVNNIQAYNVANGLNEAKKEELKTFLDEKFKEYSKNSNKNEHEIYYKIISEIMEKAYQAQSENMTNVIDAAKKAILDNQNDLAAQIKVRVEAQQKAESERDEAIKAAGGGNGNDLVRVKPVLLPYKKDIYDQERATYTFGRHPTLSDGSDKKAPIRWIKIDEKDGAGLFVTEQILDCRKYNETTEAWKALQRINNKFYKNEALQGKFWTESDLCKWLNDEFLSKAFTPAEQLSIKEEQTIGSKVFLLSVDEVKKAFKTDKESTYLSGGKYYYNQRVGVEKWAYSPLAQAMGTEYAKQERDGCVLYYYKKGKYVSDSNNGKWLDGSDKAILNSTISKGKVVAVDEFEGKSWYWLRTPGESEGCAADVSNYGFVFSGGSRVNSVGAGVRPALWLNL